MTGSFAAGFAAGAAAGPGAAGLFEPDDEPWLGVPAGRASVLAGDAAAGGGFEGGRTA